MPTLNFKNKDLPDGQTYAVEVPEGQSADVVAKSLEDSGWRLVEDETENAADSQSTGTTPREAQSAPTTPEGI